VAEGAFFSISGTVTAAGAPLAGVAMDLTGKATAGTTTDANGHYSFSGLANGDYTITPTKEGDTFAPASRNPKVNGADVPGQDFTATPVTYSISGTVTAAGAGLAEVTIVIWSANDIYNIITGSTGSYSFSGLANGDYTITPTKDGYTFTPESLTVTVSNGNVPGQNFTATPSTLGHAIAGTVTTSDGTALSTVAITLSGTATDGITTDSDGNYGFPEFANGDYTITPGKTGYTFTPPSRDVKVNGADVTGQDFTATFIGYSLSGKVTNGGAGLAGVTIDLGGAATDSATTDSDGNYTLSGLASDDYTITPGMSGYTFYPPSRSVRVGAADGGRENFATSLEESVNQAIDSIDGPDASARIHVYGELPVENPYLETLFPEAAALIAAGSTAVPDIVPKFAGNPPFSQDSALVIYAHVLSKINDKSAVSALADFLENNLTGEVDSSIDAVTHALKTLTGQEDPYNGMYPYSVEEIEDTIEQARKWLEEHPGAARLGQLLAADSLGAGTPATGSCSVGIVLTDDSGVPLKWTDPRTPGTENHMAFRLNI
jgi:hypothetical protein